MHRVRRDYHNSYKKIHFFTMLALQDVGEHVMPQGNYRKHSGEKKHHKIHKHHLRERDFYFTENKPWLNAIKENECPECEEPIKKTGIKRTCTFNTNHLEVYGDPKLVAYHKQDIIILPKIKPGTCEDCGHSLIEDIDRGEWYCGKCGLVSDMKMMLHNNSNL